MNITAKQLLQATTMLVNELEKLEEGAIFHTNSCGEVRIVSYVSFKHIEVEFINTGTRVIVQGGSLRKGQVKDPMAPTVCGKGYIGVGEHSSKYNGKMSTIYGRWKSMISRCYNPKDKVFNRYGAKGVSVCSEWLNFQNYADWFINLCESINEDPYTTTLQVDKDALAEDFKVYSPTTCCLLTAKENVAVSCAKEYTLISPTGDVVTINNLNDFCKHRGMHTGSLHQVTTGKRKQYMGWTAA